ncbi:cyclophilin-like fold protein [Rhizobium sp. CNPSo 4039]|uniref:cyclophilin-like fold protein n=1 Tax=Rhizobium sp. CNPSo 4039 TaxID=3021409 RepID=UPI00254EBF7F|nr:cyclophilin-like fold protein [Rhizobium sp. CNPSo 4039]MDK4717314.1 cyclophilin-like fold protein [Rhizobium sp. CNPSo 4039]
MTRLRNAALAGLMTAGLARSPEAAEKIMNIRIEAGGQVIEAVLDDSAAARSFAALLPLKLTLTDYAATEKISDLPARLVTDGAPPGIMPVAGDLTYYAPWGNLAIFHKGFRYSEGLVKLGRIRNGLEILQQSGPVEVTIQQVKGEAHELAQ